MASMLYLAVTYTLATLTVAAGLVAAHCAVFGGRSERRLER